MCFKQQTAKGGVGGNIFTVKTVISHGVRDRLLQENHGLRKVCMSVCVYVCVRLTNINTLSLTRDLCRSQLDLILIYCFSLLLFFGKMFTQQARQIHIYKYVIKNSLRDRSCSDQHLGAGWASTFSRDQKRWCLLPDWAHRLQIRLFPKQTWAFS